MRRTAATLSEQELAEARRRRPLVDATPAVRLRRTQTPPEGVLWSIVRARRLGGLKFRRQHPLGVYVADFYCHAARLIVEVDGGSHTGDDGRQRDRARDLWMRDQGIATLRVPVSAVSRDASGVARRIREVAEDRIRALTAE